MIEEFVYDWIHGIPHPHFRRTVWTRERGWVYFSPTMWHMVRRLRKEGEQ